MNNVKEQTIEQYLVHQVESLGGRCLKFITEHCVGMPDRLVLLPNGISVWVELKRPKGGRLSEIQRYRHRELESLGQRAMVLWNRADVDKFIEEIKEKSLCSN